VQRGVALLVERQENYLPEQGAAKTAPARDAAPREWPYEGVYRVGGDIPIGYRIGGTSIAAHALIDVCEKPLRADVAEAVRRGLEFVLEGLAHPLMAPEWEQGYDVRGWGHAYALDFLLALREHELVPRELGAQVGQSIQSLIRILCETEIGGAGGWNYSRPQGDESSASTFMTAPTLQILFEAARQGEKVDAQVVERALKTLEDARLETGAFQYGTNPERQTGQGFEAVMGATGRMAVCETTLYLAGRGSLERMRGAIDAFFANWEWLEIRRKGQGTHVAPYMIAPYYFFYAHRYVAQAIQLMPAGEQPEYRRKLHNLLWQVREEDGGWNDRIFPRSESFGTAMTLFALHEGAARAPAGWGPGANEGPAGQGAKGAKGSKGPKGSKDAGK